MQRDYDVITRQRLKRILLDKLAAQYEFPVPPGMVEMEFNSIWSQYQQEKEVREQAGARVTAPAGDGPIDAAAVIAPEETALEGASDRSPVTAEAAQPHQQDREHGHEPATHHSIPHPGSAAEPIDAAAVIAPEETALEGASDTEPGAAPDPKRKRRRRSFSASPSDGCGSACCLPRLGATTI